MGVLSHWAFYPIGRAKGGNIIKEVYEISKVLINLIRAGTVLRVVYCLIRMAAAEDEFAMFKKRTRNTVVFYVTAECIFQIKDMIIAYFT
jgi:hypothetical protein